MEINTEASKNLKWELMEACHKKLLDLVGHEKFSRLAAAIENTALYLCLCWYDFRCKCGNTQDLTMQHVVRSVDIMDQIIYHQTKNYWKNILILCRGCHVAADKAALGDKFTITDPMSMGFISEEKIQQVRKYFYGTEPSLVNIPFNIINDVVKDIKPKKKIVRERTSRKLAVYYK